MPIISPSLVRELNLDGSPNSLQRVELAIHQRFDGMAALLASPEDLSSLLGYLRPVYERYAHLRQVAGESAAMEDRQGQRLDLLALLAEVFERGNGQVLFRACYQRLDCTAHLRQGS